MTKQECKNLPLKEMYNAVLDQLALTRREYKLFCLYYMEGLTLQEAADEMAFDIQLVQRLHRKILWKLRAIDVKKIPRFEYICM